MNSYFSSNFRLGILGGGQLGKMLLYETRKYDISTAVLDPNPDAPARLAANYFQVGDLQDYETVFEFGKKVDVLTFEIENVNVQALLALEQLGKKVYPSAHTLLQIQDKGVQKNFYKKHNLPTSPFEVFASKEELVNAIKEQKWSLPFVWKTCKGGYDGMGVKVIRQQKDIASLPEAECIAEQLIPFKNELAVIVVRSVSGETKTYPVVEMEFHPAANQVEYVLSPARVPTKVSKKATEIALKVSSAFQHVGILAVELFQTEDDQILINEVAPRPHNSGHFSIESSFTNQFEQHLRAILNLPLGETKQKLGAVMVNLVGHANYTGEVYYQHIEKILALPGVTPHIYGKKQTRPYRKMGHVTIVHEDLSLARKIAQQVKEQINVISKPTP